MKKLLLGVASLIALVAIVVLSGLALLGRTTANSPDPVQKTAGSLAILAPTQTSLPIATETPTTVPRPTQTKIPTPTPTPIDAATILYVNQTHNEPVRLLKALGQLLDLLGAPLPNDATWNQQLHAAVAEVIAVKENVLAATPSKTFAVFHMEFVGIVELCSDSLSYDFPPNIAPSYDDVTIGLSIVGVCIDEMARLVELMPVLPAHSIPITDAAEPTPTLPSNPSASAASATTAQDANLRAGPGTDYPIVGSAAIGQALVPVARNEAGDWLLLDSGSWIAAFLVINAGSIPDMPIADTSVSGVQPAAPTAIPVAPTEAPTAIPPTAIPQPTTASAPSCDPNYTGACIPLVGYDLNCPDVGIKDFYSVGSDPHGFDRDNDGVACES